MRRAFGEDVQMGGERSLSPLPIGGRGSVPSKFPSAASAINAAWLELTFIAGDLLAWTRTLVLGERFRTVEPKRLRYTLVHVAGILIRHGRGHLLRVAAGWPWAHDLADSFARLQRVPLRAWPRPPGGNRPPPATKHPLGHTANPPRPLPRHGPATIASHARHPLSPSPKQTGRANDVLNDPGLTGPALTLGRPRVGYCWCGLRRVGRCRRVRAAVGAHG